MGIGVIRVDRQGLLAALQRQIEAAPGLVRGPQIGQRVGEIGLDGERFSVRQHRFIQAPLADQKVAEIIVRVKIIGIQGKGPGIAFRRAVEITQIEFDIAHKIVQGGRA